MLYINKHFVEFITFPNKERRLDLPQELLDEKPGNLNDVYWYYENDESIFELFLLDDTIHSLGQFYNLYIGYMPYSRMDRVQNPGTAFSLDILTRMIAKMTKALLTVYILDPHSPVTLEKLRRYMPGRAHEIKYSLAKDVLNYTNLNPEDAWFVFPDKGAAQRYNYEEYPNVIICEKVRDFATGKIEGIKAHIHKETKRPKENSPIIIIDDLCSYGGTFVGAIKAIETDLDIKSENNWLIVTHAEEAIDMGQVPVTFSKIFSTDSIAIPQGHTNMSISEYDDSKKVYIQPVLDIIQDISK
jgi:phosphoribosyltransferase